MRCVISNQNIKHKRAFQLFFTKTCKVTPTCKSDSFNVLLKT